MKFEGFSGWPVGKVAQELGVSSKEIGLHICNHEGTEDFLVLFALFVSLWLQGSRDSLAGFKFAGSKVRTFTG